MMISRSKALKHYILGVALGLLVFVLSYFVLLIPSIGYEVLGYLYVFTLVAQIIFYWHTSNGNYLRTIINFMLNFFLWTFELVELEHLLEGTTVYRFLYHTDELYALRFILGGLLWATNKLILDIVIE
jgi:hypothetical protein